MVFDSAKPGVVSVKKSIIDEPEEVSAIKTSKDALEAASLPATLPPAGLSEMRQAYLYKQVRPHAPAAFQDEICPKPSEMPMDLLPDLEPSALPVQSTSEDV